MQLDLTRPSPTLVQQPIAHYLWIMIILILMTGCAGVSEVKDNPPVVAYALTLQGTPYRYGKASPEEGFDCSGFVQHVYAEQGIRLPRTVSEMAATLPEVSESDLQAGDLVFFNTSGNKPSHVGLFIQDNQFIHAPSSRTGKVLISTLQNQYWRERFTGVRRPAGD